MFLNGSVKKTLEIVHEELQSDESLRSRTEWKPEDISELLEILVETLFKTIDGKIYFQRDGLPIGKSISKPMAGIYICIGLRRHSCLVKKVDSGKILCFGSGRWMIFFSSGEDQEMSRSCLCAPFMELNIQQIFSPIT